MRLSIKLLNPYHLSVNSLSYTSDLAIARGETVDVVFQLVQDNGVRYIPANDAVVTVIIPRNKTIIGVVPNSREEVDHTINREAEQVFPKDGSIFKIPLTANETKTLISGAIEVVITEGISVRKARLNQAIRIVDGQEK